MFWNNKNIKPEGESVETNGSAFLISLFSKIDFLNSRNHGALRENTHKVRGENVRILELIAMFFH